jgi:hypothetical protein
MLREQFIQRRLSGESLSLAAFAREQNCDIRTMERHSAQEGWVAELGAITRARLVVRLQQLKALRLR